MSPEMGQYGRNEPGLSKYTCILCWWINDQGSVSRVGEKLGVVLLPGSCLLQSNLELRKILHLEFLLKSLRTLKLDITPIIKTAYALEFTNRYVYNMYLYPYLLYLMFRDFCSLAWEENFQYMPLSTHISLWVNKTFHTYLFFGKNH